LEPVVQAQRATAGTATGKQHLYDRRQVLNLKLMPAFVSAPTVRELDLGDL
jgi:hypothetical protein